MCVRTHRRWQPRREPRSLAKTIRKVDPPSEGKTGPTGCGPDNPARALHPSEYLFWQMATHKVSLISPGSRPKIDLKRSKQSIWHKDSTHVRGCGHLGKLREEHSKRWVVCFEVKGKERVRSRKNVQKAHAGVRSLQNMYCVRYGQMARHTPFGVGGRVVIFASSKRPTSVFSTTMISRPPRFSRAPS